MSPANRMGLGRSCGSMTRPQWGDTGEVFVGNDVAVGAGYHGTLPFGDITAFSRPHFAAERLEIFRAEIFAKA
jgi:hypothetical protein